MDKVLKRPRWHALLILLPIILFVITYSGCIGEALTPEPELVIQVSMKVSGDLVEKKREASEDYDKITGASDIDSRTTVRTNDKGNADLMLVIKPRGKEPGKPICSLSINTRIVALPEGENGEYLVDVRTGTVICKNDTRYLNKIRFGGGEEIEFKSTAIKLVVHEGKDSTITVLEGTVRYVPSETLLEDGEKRDEFVIQSGEEISIDLVEKEAERRTPQFDEGDRQVFQRFDIRLPTPTPTPEPTATSTPGAAAALAAQPGRQGVVKGLLAPIPADYDTVIFVDLKFILEDPDLREALEEQGVFAFLGSAADPIQEQGDVVVLASGGGGVLGVTRGPLNAEEFINALKAPGSEVESESYGAFEILKVEVEIFLRFSLAISLLDDTTAVFGISFSPATPSVDLVKAALDTVDGSTPGFLSDPAVEQLVDSIPQGFSMVISRKCGSPDVVEGCTGSAISHIKRGAGVVSNEVFGFSTPEMAEAALPAIEEEVSNDFKEPLALLGITQEGNLIRVLGSGDISTAILGVGN